MHFHASNKASKDIILESIPRRPDSFSSWAQPGDWVNNLAPRLGELLEWVYYIMDSLPDKVLLLEFRRTSANGQLRATSYQIHSFLCRNPTLAKCEGEAQHLEKVRSWSPLGLSNVQSSIARPKTPCIGVFLVSLERS